MEQRFSDIQLKSIISEMGMNAVFKYLSDRGIDQQDIEDNGLRIGMAYDLGLTHDERLCVVFPHFDIRGNIIDWWSARLVEGGTQRSAVGFSALVPVKRPKMYCPPKEPPAAYLPPTLDWTQIDEGQTIFIHESCIKALNGAKCGYYSIGLNGVWGWGSKKHEIALLPQIKDLPWKSKKLRCVVVFDSNAATNDDVALAIRKFAERMRMICGVEVKHKLLPPHPEGRDWGFDDFCVHHGLEHATEWLNDGEETTVDLSEVETMRLQLNQEVVIVRAVKRVVEQSTGTMMGKGEFCDLNYAHYTAITDDDKVVNVPRLWLMWDRRRSVERMEYTPGGPPLVENEYLNLWRGMGCDPRPGDVKPWLDLLAHNIRDERIRKWLIQWFAYPIQNLGAKLNTYIHMYGPPGSGKNAILHPIIKIYGDNALTMGRERIASDFNEVYAAKQFINLDELHGGNDRDSLAITNKIKMLTTSPKLVVNGKGKGEYSIDNHVNLVTSANYADALKLDENDRRALVLRVGEVDTVIRDATYWTPYFRWADNEGPSALYDYLLGVDLTGFDPKGWAPMTEDKNLVTESTRSGMEQWVRDLEKDPDLVIPPVLRGARVLTPEQLAFAYTADDPMGKISVGLKNKLGVFMRDRGFQCVIVKLDGTTRRLWLIDKSISPNDTEVMRQEFARYKSKV